MDCDLASDLSKQVALLLPPLLEYTYLTSSNDPSFVLASNNIEERIVLASNDIQGEEPSEEPREEILPLPEDPSSIVLRNNDTQEEELSNSRVSADAATSQVNL